jgi:hypothetical protein
LCFDEVIKRLFEGDEALIPRRGIGCKSIQFEVVGQLIVHSVLEGGPGFPFFANWVVDYILEKRSYQFANFQGIYNFK